MGCSNSLPFACSEIIAGPAVLAERTASSKPEKHPETATKTMIVDVVASVPASASGWVEGSPGTLRLGLLIKYHEHGGVRAKTLSPCSV